MAIQTIFTTYNNLAASAVLQQSLNVGYYDISTAEKIVGSVFSTVDGTLQISQSLDGSNFDIVDTLSVPANTPTKVFYDAVGSCMRFTYTNGAIATTTFRLMLGKK